MRPRKLSGALPLVLLAVAAHGCGIPEGTLRRAETVDAAPLPIELRWHRTHDGEPPWPHILTCYGGCEEPHYDPSACGGSTACCTNCIDGTWWYSTEQSNFGCGAKLELRYGDRCVIVEVADNGPATWVEEQAAEACGGSGHIIDTSPLVHDYFGGGCGFSECFWIDVRPVDRELPAGICPSCPCDGPPAPPILDLAAVVDSIPDQPRDLCRDGASADVFDLRVGQETRHAFYISSIGASVANSVVVGLEVETPALTWRRWDLYVDGASASCGDNWCLSAANTIEENPPHDLPGTAAALYLGAIPPGTVVLVAATVAGSAPSGPVPAQVRLWVKHVDGAYDKERYDSTDFDNVGGAQTFNDGDLRLFTETHVLGAEVCNHLDDDCDGEVDEACLPDPNAGGADGSVPWLPPWGSSRQPTQLTAGCSCRAGPTAAGWWAVILMILAGWCRRGPRRWQRSRTRAGRGTSPPEASPPPRLPPPPQR